jgi:hypothetical protein
MRPRSLRSRRAGGPRAACLAFAVLLFAGCAGLHRGPALVVGEVLELSQSGLPPEEIVERMRAAGGVYRLRASELADLRARGVPDEVIDYMQETWLEQVRREAWIEERARLGSGPFCRDSLLRR